MPDENGQATIDDFVAMSPSPHDQPAAPATTAKRFEYSIEPKEFYLNDDRYEAVAIMPFGLVAKVAGLKMDTNAETIDKILDFFGIILMDEYVDKFKAGTVSKTKPIGMPQVMGIINWLLEEYGLRPTQPSADSSSTSESADGSTPSTAGASPTA
jgi:hypothetical protein